MASPSDTELITHTLQGDSTAFDTLVERYKQAVYGVCVSVLRDFDLAQDLTQETFLKAFQHLDRLAMPERFGNWLRIIAVNECRLHLRRARAAHLSVRALTDQGLDGQAHLTSVDAQQEWQQQQDYTEWLRVAALQALGNLSETSRQSITLHYLSGYRLKDVAAFLGITPAAAKMRLHRARQQLQQEAITMVEKALQQQQLGPQFTTRVQLADLTIFFSDIVGFVQVGNQVKPEEGLEMLYEYMSEMTQIILDTAGTLGGYAGDAIMAFWGAPIPSQDHAVKGCLAALDMQTSLQALTTKWHSQGKPAWRIRCGLDTGKVFVGDMGSRQRQTYTVLGKAVNLASFFERANAPFDTAILIGQETYARAQDAIEARLLGQVKQRLYPEPITVYEVLARKGALAPHKAQAVECFLEGLEHYHTRRWEQALPAFEAALQHDPSDGPSKYYRQKCETLLASLPEWVVF
jgi:RNA polymerase sigma factor (sigma-70 family)